MHAQGGVTLQSLHAALTARGLGMINLGSISEQTLAGMLTTATHGTGLHHKVLSTHVQAVRLLLADGAKLLCSRDSHPDLFFATLCGLGSTGIILDVRLEVAPAFRLREVQETFRFDDVINQLDAVARSAEFVRLWWWPQVGDVRVSAMDKTQEPRRPLQSWLWHSLMGHHVIQFLLFLGIFISRLNIWVGWVSSWLVRDKTVSIDDSLNVFNIDCKYRHYTIEWAVPYSQAQSCLRELRDWLDTEFNDPHGLQPHCGLEIRFSDADDIWLSPSYGQRTCWIGIQKTIWPPRSISRSLRALRGHRDPLRGTLALGEDAQLAARRAVRALPALRSVPGTAEGHRSGGRLSQRVCFTSRFWSNGRALRRARL